MKRLLVGLFLFIGAVGFAHADRYDLGKSPQELSDYFWEMSYDITNVSTNPLVGSTASYIEFEGYGTDLHVYYLGSGKATLTLSTSATAGGQSFDVVDGENYDLDFAVPFSSHTFVRYDALTVGTTLHITVGGLKKK